MSLETGDEVLDYEQFSTFNLHRLKASPLAALKFAQSALRYFNRVDNIVFLGSVSIELGLNLERAAVVIEHLVSCGKIRPVSPDERRMRGIMDDVEAYVLVERAPLGDID